MNTIVVFLKIHCVVTGGIFHARSFLRGARQA